MSEPLKKLLLFAAVFVGAAVIILFITPKPLDNNHRAAMISDSDTSGRSVSAMLNEIERLKALLKAQPDNIEHMIQIGNLYFDISRPNESIEYYEKALAFDPRNPFVLTDCAVMYSHLGQFEKSIDYLDSALAIKPDLSQAYFNKGAIFLMGLGQPDSAISAWTEFLKVAPDSVQANLVRRQIEDIKAGKTPRF